MIQRRAVDSTGEIGSFYDIHRDYVLGRSIVTTKPPISQLHQLVKCDFINGKTQDSQNMLRTIGIEDDQRLNIRLDPKLRNGIGALVDHPYPVNKYSRFLYFSSIDCEQRLPDDPCQVKKCLKSLARPVEATYIITTVNFGIDALVVLQLPDDNDDMSTQIDGLLKEVKKILEGNESILTLRSRDKNLLTNIIETKVYSNTAALNKMNSILDICQYMSAYSERSDMYPPFTYSLRPIQWLYPEISALSVSYVSLDQSAIDELERYLTELSNQIKRVQHSLKCNSAPLHSAYLQGQMDKVHKQWLKLKQSHEKEVSRLRDMIIAVRRDEEDVSMIDEAFIYKNQTILEDSITKLTGLMDSLGKKGEVISDLIQEHFYFCNAADRDVNEHDNELIWKQKLSLNERYDQILCSTDRLKAKDPSKWETFCCQLADEHKKNSSFRILYADFSYCSFELSNTIILGQNSASSSPEDIINVLLVGESGVGKSTFINALINYVTFKTFEQAESSKPVVLIPVSFLITTGRNFEEHTVKFGDSDALHNEDFDHSGQSVTQHCKSYVFHLHHNGGRKVRIIDTPGFGDTRGVEQDDRNMEDILDYISRLTHLNAVCFLLKPNVSQINNFFQVCLTQLLDLLGSNASQSIIFCFTNARSTFYTPGDTAPLLKGILKLHSMSNIPFKKVNTFCFDNESFRYLVALQDGVSFNNDQEKDEYKMSWSTSVKEANRLIEYLCTSLNARHIVGDKQSIKHAQFEILSMVRPILETMRNIVRNIILADMDIIDKSIELIPTHLSRPTMICSICRDGCLQRGQFWVLRDIPHNIRSTCQVCSHPPNQHMIIQYKLDYEYSDKSSSSDRTEMKAIIGELRHSIVEFGHFLVHVARSSKDDPFWIGLTQMISEENDLCNSQKPNEMNLRLADDLRRLMTRYEQRINDMKPNQEHSKLPIIYEWIETIRINSIIKVQMDAVKRTQKTMMELDEYEIPEDLTNT